MTLGEEESREFYILYYGIFVWVNKKLKLFPDVIFDIDKQKLDLEKALAIRAEILKNPNLINDYLSVNKDILTEEEYSTIELWRKYYYTHAYYIVRNQKKYSVFMRVEDGGVLSLYGVKALGGPLSIDFFRGHELPISINAILLPFKDIIICDSFLGLYDDDIDDTKRNRINLDYYMVKERLGITESLPRD